MAIPDGFCVRCTLIRQGLGIAFTTGFAALSFFAVAADLQQTREPVVVFQHINDVIRSGSVKLANGVEVRRADWPTLILAEIPTPAGDQPRTCTGTLVGPNVILLAAHCIDSFQGKDLRAQLWIASRKITMLCEAHPDYRKAQYNFGPPRNSQDFALCLLDDGGNPPPLFEQMRFEVVDATAPLKAGEPVLMTGYGCDKLTLAPNGRLAWEHRQDKLWVGDATIEAPAMHWKSDPSYATIRSDAGMQPALCPGDSGGPLFTGVTSSATLGARRIRGVNSKICTRRRGDSALCTFAPGLGEWDIVSSVSATGIDSFRTWAVGWVAQYEVKKPVICGVNRLAGQAPCAD